MCMNQFRGKKIVCLLHTEKNFRQSKIVRNLGYTSFTTHVNFFVGSSGIHRATMEATSFSQNYPRVLSALKAIYGKKMLEIEQKYRFDEFWQQTLRGSDIDGGFHLLCFSTSSSKTNGLVTWTILCRKNKFY